MTDADVLKLLAALGMDDLSFRVLPVLPAIAVAWADGEIQEAEAVRIRAFADRFAPGRDGTLLMDNWLRYPPSAVYLKRGLAALAALSGREGSPLALPASALPQAQEAARDVAKAHGGFLGFGAISRSEADVLDALRASLEGANAADPGEVETRRRVTITCNTLTFDPIPQSAVVVPDSRPEHRVPVEENGVIVGSGPGCTIRVENDPTITAEHARIFSESRRFYIEDLESSSGTYVDGERIAKRRLLGGEQLRVGAATLTFKLLRRIPLQMIR